VSCGRYCGVARLRASRVVMVFPTQRAVTTAACRRFLAISLIAREYEMPREIERRGGGGGGEGLKQELPSTFRVSARAMRALEFATVALHHSGNVTRSIRS